MNKRIILKYAGVTAAALLWGTGQSYAQYALPPQLVPGVDYMLPNYANSPILTKFVDGLPGLTSAGANNLGQYIPVAVADTTTFPGSDYYEIALVEYTEQMHSELLPTKLRGYVQLATTKVPGNVTLPGTTLKGVDKPSYLGPVIVAKKGTPTRIKFYNLLPVGAAGDLFIPTDITVMGAGTGPDGSSYSQNRATLHLHGGDNPWISDGTAHQWITPAGQSGTLLKGVSQQNVPDMPAAPAGSATFYWPNGQSGRLMFYHDHAFGMTRLNLYGGEAAGYLLTDTSERALNTYAPGGEIPLIIQDKTFVWGSPSNQVTLAPATGTFAVDPLWASNSVWGQTLGSLWFPHVYMPNQNPNDLSGANPLGRWDYGAWFWPVFPSAAPPQTSIVPEAFMDTPVINGTAYPYLTVDPKAYRFRILNACNDRFVNLQLYVADPANGGVAPGANGLTEVKMVDANLVNSTATVWPSWWTVQTPGMIPDIIDGRPGGLPDPTLIGPNFVQIGTEGGLLPAVAVLQNTPVGYVQNKRDITVGSIGPNEHTLLLGPAERGDVFIDFSAFAGKTIILYSDSPAPVPAGDPRNDYYTGDPDNTVQGGAPTTLVGKGPNTRTLMQIRVSTAAASPLDLAGLTTAVAAAYTASGLPAPIVPRGSTPGVNIAKISDTSLTFNGGTTPLQPKTIQELFDPYGRMNATLGVEIPFTTATVQTTIPYGFADPATEVIPDGATQLWKITHNGVDTHAIHFHLFNVQVVNRVGWDGAIRLPEANEMGWKDTVRMNPLEDVVVALTAKTPTVPFPQPNNIRPLDPTQPASFMFTGVVDPSGLPVTAYPNSSVNFGNEYTWHCHLLGHEENDMMRPMMVAVPPAAGPTLTATLSGNGANTRATLNWTAIPGATGYTVQRAGNSTFTSGLVTTQLGNVTTYANTIGNTSAPYYYRVLAVITVGSGVAGFPSLNANSPYSNTASVNTALPPAAPSNLTATILSATSVRLNWTDNANNETGFEVWRSVNGGASTLLTTLAANTTTYTDGGVSLNGTYAYRVRAVNATGNSAYAGPVSVTIAVPAAPSGLTATAARANGNNDRVTLGWTDNSNNESSFTIQRATNAGFTAGLNTSTVAANSITAQQTGLNRNASYYYRIQSVNAVGVSAWVNATPFPVVTP